MSLSIKISKKAGGRSDMIASRSWPQNKISIGRGEECTLVLEDPKKHVSRVHVELEEKYEGTFQLTVISKVNPVFVNGKRHAPGSQMALSAGDRFELGEYELELLAPPKTDYKAAPVLDVEETTRPDNPMLQMPKAEAAKPVSEKTVPVETAAPEAAAAPAEAEEPALDHSKLPPVEPGIFDEPGAAVAPAPAAAAEGDVFAESTYVGASSAPPSNLFDEATYVGGRPPGQGAGPAGAGQSGGGGGMRAAVQAFLEGAGLQDKEISDAEIEAFLLQSGKIMRAAVEGAMALLVARATAKKELRAEDRTMVASKDNNPLKLMSDPEEALAFLFDTKDRAGGFLDPVRAMGDAFDDLRTHEVALFAGMRAALLGSIQRFDPKTLEAELEKNAGGLGLNRKAKLWEQFAAFQQKLARDAEDDFNKVFGREFMGTYMEQVKRLRGSR
ncbi:MAG TPA: type VI secretion system-associated FHA domain protein TagH [Burkholderiales bacterium]|nr:type VI secretion system-associated FHA domain protein TagH [Burkholderiales bacterium]